MPEQFDSPSSRSIQPSTAFGFSTEACDLLGATVREYLEGGGAPEALARATARLCREAHTRGFSADETLAEVRSTLARILGECAVTPSDRVALVALAIDECVHAFYDRQR